MIKDVFCHSPFLVVLFYLYHQVGLPLGEVTSLRRNHPDRPNDVQPVALPPQKTKCWEEYWIAIGLPFCD